MLDLPFGPPDDSLACHACPRVGAQRKRSWSQHQQRQASLKVSRVRTRLKAFLEISRDIDVDLEAWGGMRLSLTTPNTGVGLARPDAQCPKLACNRTGSLSKNLSASAVSPPLPPTRSAHILGQGGPSNTATRRYGSFWPQNEAAHPQRSP